MPTYIDDILKQLRNPRFAGTASRMAPKELLDAVQEDRGKSLLEGAFDWLDMPGAAVRFGLTGDLGGAARAAGSFALPFLVDQPENKPDFGLLGNLATDPLMYFTGGGGGAAEAVTKAVGPTVGRAATKAVGRAVSRTATKAGSRVLEPVLDVLLRRGARAGLKAGEIGPVAPAAFKAWRKGAREAVSFAREARGPTGGEFLADLTRKGLLDQGGLKIGLPFMEGKTIARAGKATNLAMISPYYWGAKWAGGKLMRAPGAAKAARYIQKGWRGLLKSIYPGKHFSEAGDIIRAQGVAQNRGMESRAAHEVVGMFGEWSDDAVQDFTQTLYGKDFRRSGVDTAEAFKAKYPHLPYDETLQRYKPFVESMREDLISRGIWQKDIPEELLEKRLKEFFPDEAAELAETNKMLKKSAAQTGEEYVPATFRSMFPELKLPEQTYVPQQFSDATEEAIEMANWEAELANTADLFGLKSAGPRGTGITSKFMQTRKHVPVEKFEEAIGQVVQKAGGDVPYIPDLDIRALLMKRASSHARTVANFDMLQKAKRVLGGERVIERGLSKDAARAVINSIAADRKFYRIQKIGKGSYDVIEKSNIALRDRAFAEWIANKNVGQRSQFWDALNWVNKRTFKPFVTIGVGPIPNPAFHIRNMISGIWQATAHPEIGLESGLRHTTQIIYDGVAKAIEAVPGMKKLPRSQLTRILQGKVTDELVAGTKYTERQIAEALASEGVTIGFSATEMLGEVERVKEMSGARKLTHRVWEMFAGTKFPAMVAQGIESRMRAQGFVHALKKGLSLEDAAKATRDAFIDYEVVSGFHRGLRDVVPFAQFTIGQTPRTVKTLLERPRVLSPLVAAGGEEEGVRPSWVAEQPNFSLGKDLEGNQAYLAGLGTPFEDINKFWAGSFGRTAERGIGQTAPPIKAIYEQASGREPYFGREIGSYKRDTPFTRMLPDALVGRSKRTIGDRTVSQVSPVFHYWAQKAPYARQLSMLNQMLDERKTAWHKAISLLTGAKVVSVDEDRELRKLVLEYLRKRADTGDVGTFQKFFAYMETDPELKRIIRAYYAGKKR